MSVWSLAKPFSNVSGQSTELQAPYIIGCYRYQYTPTSECIGLCKVLAIKIYNRFILDMGPPPPGGRPQPQQPTEGNTQKVGDGSTPTSQGYWLPFYLRFGLISVFSGGCYASVVCHCSGSHLSPVGYLIQIATSYLFICCLVQSTI